MVRPARALALLLCCAAGCGSLLAQNPQDPASAPAGDELKTLHQMLEQQSRQIDVLAQEIARLNLLLEGKVPTSSGLAPSPAESPAPSSPPKALPVEAPAAAPASAADSPSGPVHIVAKGETLTAIAKRYKVTVPDLLKVNKIADVRKLQIGQTLALPPDAKFQESPTPSPAPPAP